MTEQNAIVVQQQRAAEMTLAEVRSNIHLVKQVLQEVMVKDHHFGTVPGTRGQVLFKAGAEKLAQVFRLAPIFDVQRHDLPGGHREYVVTCRMTHAPSGTFLGSGVRRVRIDDGSEVPISMAG